MAARSIRAGNSVRDRSVSRTIEEKEECERNLKEGDQKAKGTQQAAVIADSTDRKPGRLGFLKTRTVTNSNTQMQQSDGATSTSSKIQSRTGTMQTLDRSSPSTRSHHSEAPPRSRGVALWALAMAKYGPPERKLSIVSRRPMFWRLASQLSSNSRMMDRGQMRKIQYSNSYQLGPQKLFCSQQLETILQQILHAYLDGEDYKPAKSVAMISSLSDVIKQRVKDMNLPRYKIVSFVLIGQNTGQSFFMASRCICNSSTDNFAQASYQNSGIFAVATVHVMYQE